MYMCICVWVRVYAYYIYARICVYVYAYMHDAYVIIYIKLYLGGTILGVHGGMRRERDFLGDAAMTFKSLRH